MTIIESMALVFCVSAAVAFVITTISTAAYLCNVHTLFKLLKIHHPQAWKALGEPHLFWNNTLRVNRVFAAVLNSNVSEEISDQKMAYRLRKTKRLYSISSISFTLSLACILAFSVFTNL